MNAWDVAAVIAGLVIFGIPIAFAWILLRELKAEQLARRNRRE